MAYFNFHAYIASNEIATNLNFVCNSRVDLFVNSACGDKCGNIKSIRQTRLSTETDNKSR